MKFLLCLILLTASLFADRANAQEYKKLRLEISTGLLKFGSSYLPLSIGVFYGITDNFMVGYRPESGPRAPNGLVAHSFIGRYYFDFKPHSRKFIGLGPGIYATKKGSSFDGTAHHPYPALERVGGLAQIGIDYRHLTIALEYNFMGKTTYEQIPYYSAGFRIGFFIFGGKKNP